MDRKTYIIAGYAARMSAEQADAWNSGEAIPENMAGAVVYVPTHEPDRSWVRNGEVVVSLGLPTYEAIPLAEIISQWDSHPLARELGGHPAIPRG